MLPSMIMMPMYIDNKITMDIPAKISDDVVAVMRQNAEAASAQ